MVLIIIVFACSKKTITTTETKTQGPADKADSEPESALIEEKLISNTPVKTDPAHNDMLVAGQRVYTAYCGRCHALNPVEKFTAHQWEGILKNMIPKAKLNTKQSEQVTTFVMANAKK